jgi:enoyl-CoA hydratase/carnithine racemase
MAEPAVEAQPAVRWEAAGDGVLHVLLDRPPANALGLPIVEGLHAALDHADADAGVKVLVVASRIDGFFAAGADIKHMATVDAVGFKAYGDALRGALDRLAEPERISVAAVDGVAMGGGLELAMACTLRVGSARARFGLPEVKLGLIPGAGGTQRLPRLVGRGHALDIILTGRHVEAAEAHAIGLVDRLVEDGQAEAAAYEIARELAGSSLPALRAANRTVDASFDLPLRDGTAYEAREEQDLFESGEGREGIAAFLEKRPPRFA